MGTTARSTVEIQMALKGAAQIRGGIAGIVQEFSNLRAKASALVMIEQEARKAALGVSVLQAAALNTAGVGFLRLRTHAEQAGKATTQSFKLARHEMLNLGYQVQDIGVSLAAGQSPLLVLAQQGSQIFQILQGSQGGVVGALRKVRDMLLSMKGLAITGGLALAGGALWVGNKAKEALEVDQRAAAALSGSNEDQRAFLKKQMEAYLGARAIDKKTFDSLLTEIDTKIIASAGPQDTTNAQAEKDRLNKITQRLRARVMDQVSDPALRQALDDLSFANLARETAANVARYDTELERLNTQLDEEVIDIETYLDRAKKAEFERSEMAAREVRAQIGLVDRKMQSYAKDEVEKTRLNTELIRLQGQLEEELRQHKQNVFQIEEAARLHGIKQGEKTVEEQKKYLAKMEQLKVREIQIAMGLVGARQSEINTAPGASNEQRRRTRLAEGPAMLSIYDQNIAQYRSMAASTEDEAAKLQYMERANELLAQQVELQAQLKEDAERGSFMGQLKLQAIELANQWGNLKQTMASGVLDTVSASVNGLSGALTSVIMGTQKAGAAFAQFGISLLTNFVSQILTAILWATVAIPILTALGILSGGTTVGTGLGVTMAALSAGSAAASGITGRRAGGPMVAGVPYLTGEVRPEVIVPREDSMVYPSLGAFQAQQNSRTAGETSPSNGRAAVYLVDDRKKAHKERLRRGDYDAEIRDVNQRNRTSLGY